MELGFRNDSAVPPIVHDVLHAPGQPLDAATRAFMEPRFGHDFSKVRVHADARAAESANAVNAQAYTVGRDMVFGSRHCGNQTRGGECSECSKKQRLGLQTKLKVNEPGDIYEQEADRIADQVITTAAGPVVGGTPPRIQRFTGQLAGQMDAALHGVDEVLSSPGRPLEPALRQDMERRFGHDFSRVRVHTGAVAEQSARNVNAHAYTVGHSIVFDVGRFAPATQEGRRLIAHELTHVVQQSGAERLRAARGSETREGLPAASRSLTGVIQREVNPKRIASKEPVLEKIKRIVDSTGKGKDPAEANLARLGKLGIGFNPGATKEEKDNAFVYTCHCGWIDMGHFFISAAAAYGVGYLRRRLEVRVGGTPHTIDELLAGGTNKLSTVLDLLLKTVPDVQDKQVLSDVRKLLKSGEPRDIALVFGYWMEFVQQVAKLISDPGRNLPDPLKAQLKDVLAEYDRLFKSVAPEELKGTLEGSARSAFTMEDLPSDCYGAALGQDVWKQSDGAKRDLPRIHELMKSFFSECGAVFPEENSKTRCEMMAETTPGSCRMKDGKPDWAKDLGEPARYGSTKPRLLNSAKPLCGGAPAVVPCRSATGGAGSPLPAVVADVSGKGATVTLTEDIPLHQFRERGYFGGDVSIPGRPERFDPKAPLILQGPSIVRVTPRGNVIAYSTFGGVPGLGDVETAAHLDPGVGRYGVGGKLGLRGRFDFLARGPLQLHVQGKMDIDLEALLQGVAGPELKELEAVLTSDEFTKLAKQLLGGDIKPKEFVREVKTLLRKKFPQGPKGVIDLVIWRLENMEALALATRLEAQGTVRIGSIPISGFLVHKSFGRRPLLGLEAGLVLSELARGRTIVGAKGWLYGQDIAQAQLIAGVDPIGHKAIADLHIESKMILSGGKKMTLDLRYEINPEREQRFLGMLGWEFEAFGSKPRGAK